MEWITSLPFAIAFPTLFIIVFLRANATYWLGRGAAAGSRKTRYKKYLNKPTVLKAEEVLARWGAPAITFSFLTIGAQTALNFAAGAIRMPYRWRYLCALIPGAMVWAFVYATIGLAFFSTLIDGIWKGGENVSIFIILLVIIILTTVIWRRSLS